MKNILLFCSALCLMVLASCSNTGGDPSAMLQGKWQSVDDPKSIMEITGDQLVQLYDGQNLGTRKFAYSADCSGNECAGGAGNKGCFTSAGEMDIECYSLVSISDASMETSLVGATGKTLKYTKIK